MGLFDNKYKRKYEEIAENMSIIKTKIKNGLPKFSEYVFEYEKLTSYFNELKELSKKYNKVYVESDEEFFKKTYDKLQRIYNILMVDIVKSEDKNNKIIELENDLKSSLNHGFDNVVNTLLRDLNDKKDNIDKYVVDDDNEYNDSLFDEVVEYIISVGHASASLLQRKFRIGYNRAAKLIDDLEKENIIGPANGLNPRQVLITHYNKDNSKITPAIKLMSDHEYDSLQKQSYLDSLTYEERMKKFFDIDVNLDVHYDLSSVENMILFEPELNHKEDLVKKLVTYSSPDELELYLLNTERVTFNDYSELPHLKRMEYDPRKVYLLLDDILRTMDERYEKMISCSVKTFEQYNQLHSVERLPYIFIIVDELFNVLSYKENYDLLVKILLRCQNAGVRFIAYSKVNKRNLNLGAIDDLLKAYDKYNLEYLYNSQEREIELNIIDNDMDGFDFEKYAGELLSKNGFEKIIVTQRSRDFGVDVIAYKEGIKYSIQCKKYSEPVSIKAVQEVVASCAMFDCQKAIVLTNNYFTENAKELAQKNEVLLWDRTKLQELIENAKNK